MAKMSVHTTTSREKTKPRSAMFKHKGKSAGGRGKSFKQKHRSPDHKKPANQQEDEPAIVGKAFRKRIKLDSSDNQRPARRKEMGTAEGKKFGKHVKFENGDFRKPVSKNNIASENVEKPSSRKLEKKKLIEKRKRHAKPHFELGKEVVTTWEKLRQRKLKSSERSSLVSEILEKMKGKIPEMVTSHITSRVLQTCLKYCNPSEKASIYEELRTHFFALARNTYAHHLVVKMLDQASKDQLQKLISSLHGNVVAFLRHPVGSAVVEHAYKLANSLQKKELLAEFFSPEYRLFKGIITKGECRVTDLLLNEPPSKRTTVIEHMSASLQPILEKGIVDHSIIHRALVEYFSIASKLLCEVLQFKMHIFQMAIIETVQQLCPLLIRMIHTKDGCKVGSICVAAGSRKEHKKIIKGLKGNAMKVACDQYGSVVLLEVLDTVDDTELVNKFIISELAKNVKELILHKYGRRIILHLLSPYNTRYFSDDVLKALQSLKTFPDQTNKQHDNEEENGSEVIGVSVSSKKDPFRRRIELLSSSALAEKLVEVCSSHAGELLRSPLGKDVIYEVAKGGSDNIMWNIIPDGVPNVHKAIADVGALPRGIADSDQISEEHVFEHYHSSRIIRRLMLESTPSLEGIATSSFSSVLWKTALKGNCKQWANGHSQKIVSALRQCKDLKVKEAAMFELQPLINFGLLENSEVLPRAQGIKRKRFKRTE